MTDIWNAETYKKFIDLRSKPAKDLLFSIPDSFVPKLVYDLGCGPGNSTILLQQRWPHARIIGIDSSQDMLKEAKATYSDLEFTLGDIAHFAPLEKPDCIFANASLQWVSDHEALIPRLLGLLKPQGILAIQMPNNFHYPSHQTSIRLLENNKAWQPLLKTVRYGHLTHPFYQAAYYYDLLAQSGAASIQLWETEYFQEIESHQAIFSWVQGTGLRPILSQMEKADQSAFEKAYVAEISKAYEVQKNGKILLPYKRLFMVGVV